MARDQTLKVAIIGGGPGGLATAIAFSKLPFVQVKLYEQASAPRDVGAGISIGQNAWNVLELLGAAGDLRGASKTGTHHRNAYTGEVVDSKPVVTTDSESKFEAIRARRTSLQAALLAQISEVVFEFDKKLVSLQDLGEGKGVRLGFKDQTEVIADLVVGADGIRSIVRRTLFPNHTLHFTGTTAWRVLLPWSEVSKVGIPAQTAWWHAKDGYFYFSHVDDESDREFCEVTIRSFGEPETQGTIATWAVPATNEKVANVVKDYDPRIKEVVELVPEGEWREFAMVAGPCLERIAAWGKVALIGDASHPLSGAFGSGAAFAMEDGWILAQALEHTRRSVTAIRDALEIFEEIRGPYYERMFEFLDDQKVRLQKVNAGDKGFDEVLKARVSSFGAGGGSMDWIYKNDIQQVWRDYLKNRYSITN